MKYLFFSDLHGSYFYAKKLLSVLEKESPDLIVDLGDNYYHGPRNPLPEDYAPMKAAEVLNSIAKDTVFIKGNCDSDVDGLISTFESVPCAILSVGKRKIFCTHGDKFNKDNLPSVLKKGDVLIYGHFHTGFILESEVICVNPGSLSLPKNDTLNSYAVIDEKGILLKDIDGKIINEYSFDISEEK